MTEENTEEVVDQANETQEVETQDVESKSDENSLYSSLFDIVDEEEDSSVEEKPEVLHEDVISISDAVDKISREPIDSEESDPKVEVDGQEEKKDIVEPEKSEPKKKKVKQVIDPEVPEEPVNALSENPTIEDPDKDFVDSLLPEEKEIYDLSKYASEKMPEYKGVDSQFKDYFLKTRQYIDKRLKDDPHVNLSDDQDYKNFIAREKPKFYSADARKVEQEQLLEKAENRAREKLKPEIERVRREQEKINLAPVVEKKKTEAQVAVKEMIPEEYRNILEEENGMEKLSKTKPMEFAAIDSVTGQVLASTSLLVDITTGNVQYDASNRDHVALLDWVNQEQEGFIQSGATHREGKVFMRRERYYRLPEEKRSEYYTWTDDDLVNIITGRGKEAISQAITRQHQMLKAYMGDSQPVQPVQQPVQQPAQVRQPAPSVPSTPRPSVDAPSKQVQKQNPLFTTLGM